jgi:CheY-like chemotaxis protein
MTSILVVDDDVTIRETLALVLAESGHEVQTAHDGCEAVDALLLSSAPVVVVLDVKMPRMGGEEVVRLVAEGAPELTRHAFILVSAAASSLSVDFLQLLKWLNIPLLAKPFKLKKLLTTVEAVATKLSARVDASMQSIQPGPQSH